MQNRSEALMQVAKNYIETLDTKIIYACVGGSVGRGDADQYSDLDLTIYTNECASSSKLDILYGDEIIQLEIVPIDELPDKKVILQSPWDFRFLAEEAILKDEEGSYHDLKEWAITYFNSKNGKQKMIEQVTNIVKNRCKFAMECLETNMNYSASIASMGAWTEAGFLYLYIKDNLLSTGELIPQIEKLNNHMKRFNRVSPFTFTEVSNASMIVSRYRKFLRDQGHTYSSLSIVHDTLCNRKIQRLLNNNEKLNLLWQMYGESVGLYFETSNGLPFELYSQDLPVSLQKDLSKIGFVPLNKSRTNELCTLSDELLSLSY
ncbi:nucleotidyltransferase domain-containing protein [Bacillus salitolerans]|uniref:Nucleotidyltransferase domain-containing protein n=1 Tax=Bacillus salitolerans TaxID=1437434 RepID=A0ABW4LYI9_9BACI